MNEKFTIAAQDMLKGTRQTTEFSVLIRPKQKTEADHQAQMALEQLKTEQMATRQAELLANVHQRYGDGMAFCENLKESQTKAQANLVSAAPSACSLWIANAVVVKGTRAEIEELVEHDDVEAIDVNPMFEVPEVLQTPLEDAPDSVDGNAWGVARINAPQVWGGYGRGEDVLVGHLDTGIDDTHPALAGKVAAFEEFDLNGDPVGSATHDSGSHGTHTAGTICGRNFRGTNIGVAPQSRLLSGLVLNGGSGSFAQIIGGIQWAVENGAHVINMSLGGIGYTSLWSTPIWNATQAGTLVVASIGNSGHGTSGGPGNDIAALGVGATHYRDKTAGFSGGETLVNVPHDVFGSGLVYMKPEISAPGVSVLSSIPGNGIAAFNGTSMSAPHAAGAAALIMSAAPELKGQPLAVRSILLSTVEDYGEAGRDQRLGFGRLDAFAAAQTAISLF